jgi:hypothetical protein
MNMFFENKVMMQLIGKLYGEDHGLRGTWISEQCILPRWKPTIFEVQIPTLLLIYNSIQLACQLAEHCRRQKLFTCTCFIPIKPYTKEGDILVFLVHQYIRGVN